MKENSITKLYTFLQNLNSITMTIINSNNPITDPIDMI